jgi:MerR family transcriptional regulator, copper efflux regulator
MMSSGRHGGMMTVGELSRHTGVPPKALRAYTDSGLVYTAGRSAAGYRLYHAEALSCVRWITELRNLGLTLAEIRDLRGEYTRNRRAFGPSLTDRLHTARVRIDARIAELDQTRRRIDAFEATHRAALSGTAPDICTDVELRPSAKRKTA